MSKARLPKSFSHGSWRCTLPVDLATQRMGVAFNLEDGTVLRVALDLCSAKNVHESIAEYLKAFKMENPDGVDSVHPGLSTVERP